MAVVKLCKTYQNGNEVPIYLVTGTAGKDGRPKSGEKGPAKCDVAASELQNGDTTWITLNGWRAQEDFVANIRKGDSVMAIGPLKSRIYKGKEYWELDANFISVSGAGIGVGMPAQTSGSFNRADYPDPVAGFTELDEADDGDLPF